MADVELLAEANTAFQDFTEAEHPMASPDEQKVLWKGWWACWQARAAADAGKVTKWIKIPAEAVDDEHWTVMDDAGSIGGQLHAWMRDAEVGTKVTLEVVELSAAEVAALPDI
jgi:hypothetical protein